jgi:hypothetical protein
MRLLTALIASFVLFLGASASVEGAIAKAPAPLSGPSAVKERWRVTAKMWMRDGSYRLVYITWYGLAESIDWSTAAVCEYLTYKFWSPWERAGTTFEIKSTPVLDMTTPIN